MPNGKHGEIGRDDTDEIPVVDQKLPPSNVDSDTFYPAIVEPPKWVRAKLADIDGMQYVYALPRSKLTLLLPAFIVVLAFAAALWLTGMIALMEDPGFLVHVPLLVGAYGIYHFVAQWYLRRQTCYLITVNTKTGAKSIRRVRNIPVVLRPFFGNLQTKAVPFNRIDTGGFEQGFIDGIFNLASYTSDTAALGDEWLRELHWMQEGEYLMHLVTWIGENR